MKTTRLDQQWQQLMALCESERSLREKGEHARLLKHVASEIDHLATDMGFNAKLIATREFRAERADGHIVRIVTE
jgi:nitrate/nitrite-specific signal transduction histidine kinase